MRVLLLSLFLLTLLSACDVAPVGSLESVENDVTENSADQRGSFRMRNGEIRDEILLELAKQDIQYWINDDGSIGYFSVDADAIDKIGYDVIGRYIARN